MSTLKEELEALRSTHEHAKEKHQQQREIHEKLIMEHTNMTEQLKLNFKKTKENEEHAERAAGTAGKVQAKVRVRVGSG